jgi:hypothetical protein
VRRKEDSPNKGQTLNTSGELDLATGEVAFLKTVAGKHTLYSRDHIRILNCLINEGYDGYDYTIHINL